MKEQLVTYDTAILAKKKGFNIPVQYGAYGPKMKLTQDLGFRNNPDLRLVNWNSETKQQRNSQATSVPSQSLLQKYILKTYNIFVTVTLAYEEFGRFATLIYGESDKLEAKLLVDGTTIFDNPYDAMEQGLQEALKLV